MDKASKLIENYLKGQSTPEERAQLLSHFNRYLDQHHDTLTPEEVTELSKLTWASINKQIKRPPSGKKPIRKLLKWASYAAAAVILLTIGVLWVRHGDPKTVSRDSMASVEDLPPGGNKATLTLADGRIINLDSTQSGIIIGDERIAYNDGSSSIALLSEYGASTPQEILTLTIPKGGTYQVTLPDGTQVWLNSASTLTYPARFDDQERVIFLEGEAYLDVKRQMSKSHASDHVPFKVISNGQTVEVLGTEFNISAYPDEPTIKTTLVEGSIQVAPEAGHLSPVIIKPGEQAKTHGSNIDIQSVDVAQYTAWKDGRFYFQRTPLEEIMRQISRWYDVEVVYTRGIPKETFSGKVSRNVSLMGLLDIFQISAIDLQLEGNKLIVK